MCSAAGASEATAASNRVRNTTLQEAFCVCYRGVMAVEMAGCWCVEALDLIRAVDRQRKEGWATAAPGRCKGLPSPQRGNACKFYGYQCFRNDAG